ncbi:hypothetical protein BVY01_02175 [bacterium I07]|nr:hypothetical protein BVY01_02175 [bacterium I07]
MKARMLLLASMFLLSCGINRIDMEAENEKFVELIKNQGDAMYSASLEGEQALYLNKPYIVRMFSDGTRQTGFDSVSAWYARQFENFSGDDALDLEFGVSDLHSRVYGDVAWVLSNQSTKGKFMGEEFKSQGWGVRILEREGDAWKMAFYISGSRSDAEDFEAVEMRINTIGYNLLNMKRYEEAIKLFALNTDLYPDSWNVYDSLAEAYMKKGDKRNAIRFYTKSLDLNPKNTAAIANIKKLKG